MRDNPPVALPRFYTPDLDADRRQATIGADETRHLARVMRLSPGDEVAVFDGRGHEFRARVDTVARETVRVTLIEPLTPARAPKVAMTLVQAVLKGERMDDAVRDATMIGVTTIVPVVSEHVVVRGNALAQGRPADRWRRVALASAKQCRRATLPVIRQPEPLAAWLASPSGGQRLIFVEPTVAGPRESLRTLWDRPAPERVSILVGPEGGWAADEVEAAIGAGCTPVSLGDLTLRADAVPMVALAMCRLLWDD